MQTEIVTFYGISEEALENQIHEFLDKPGINYESGEYNIKDDGSEFAFVMTYTIVPTAD